MGSVALVLDTSRDELVALKRVLRRDPAWDIRLKREFRVVEGLRHDNLVRLYDLGEDQDGLFFTMEYVRGTDVFSYYRGAPFECPSDVDERRAAQTNASHTVQLSGVDVRATTHTQEPNASVLGSARTERLSTGFAPDFPPATAFEQSLGSTFVDLPRLGDLLVQLADALAHLHANGVVHRDLKPPNVRVTPGGEVKLLDFGVLGETSSLAVVAEDGHAVGTPGFMAPEQMRGAAPSAANDAYALGCLAFMMISGRPVFQGALRDVVSSHLRIVPPTLRELGVDVSAELCSACASLLEKDPRRRPAISVLLEALPGARSASNARRSSSSSARIPLIGREAAQQLLSAHVSRAAQGVFRVVVVAGATGVGKTALSEDACTRAAAAGALVLRGRGRPTERVPFNALDGAMDGLATAIRTATIAARADVAIARELASLAFPVLRAQTGSRRIARETREVGRGDVFGAVVSLLTIVAEKSPILVFVDDLQWADDDCVALLQFVVEHAPTRVLLLATMRDDVERSAASTWLESAHAANVVQIPPLAEEQMREVLRLHARRLGAEVDAAALSRGAAACAGRPCLAAVVARAMASNAPTEGDGTQSLLVAVVAGVLDECRALLALLFARDDWSSMSELAAMLGLTLGRVDALVDTVVQYGLVRRTGVSGRDERVCLLHDTVYAALRSVLTDVEVRAAHRCLAIADGSLPSPPLHRLVRHWLGAKEPGLALTYARAAAESAILHRAYGLAAEMYGVLLTYESGDKVALLRLQAEAFGNAGRGIEAGRTYEIAASLTHGDDSLDCERRAADQYFRTGHIDEGSRVLEGVLRRVGIGFPRTHGSALMSYLWSTARLRVRGLAFRAHPRAELARDALRRLEVCWTSTIGLFMTDQVRGMDFQMRALRMALDAGEASYVARALALGASAPAALGSSLVGDSTDLLERARAAAAVHRDPATDGFVAMCAGSVAYLEGHWREAVVLLSEAEKTLDECDGVFWETGTVALNMAWSLCYLGEFKLLSERARAHLRVGASQGNLFVDLAFRSGFPSARWLVQDDPDRARHDCCDAIRHWSQRGFHLQHLVDLCGQVQIDLYEARPDRAMERIQEVRRSLAGSALTRVRFDRIAVLDLEARAAIGVALMQKDPRAVRIAERAGDALQSESLGWSKGLARLTQAGVALARGSRRAAGDHLEAAVEIFESCDMRFHAAAARWRRSQVEVGELRDALRADSELYWNEQGVMKPEAMARVVAPWPSSLE